MTHKCKWVRGLVQNITTSNSGRNMNVYCAKCNKVLSKDEVHDKWKYLFQGEKDGKL